MNILLKETGVRLIQGDVIEVLKELPPNCIDLIFADPPYNLSNDGFKCHTGKRVDVNKGIPAMLYFRLS